MRDLTVDQVLAGSIPVSHPKIREVRFGPVAQRRRAEQRSARAERCSALQRAGHRFKSDQGLQPGWLSGRARPRYGGNLRSIRGAGSRISGCRVTAAHLSWGQGGGGSNPLIPTSFAGSGLVLKAPVSGTGDRGLKSRLPDQIETVKKSRGRATQSRAEPQRRRG